MVMVKDNNELLRLFEGLSDVFEVLHLKPLWQKYNLDDTLDAASLFLNGYAFERQGRSPAFSPAAVESIRISRKENSSGDFPLAVWDNFRYLLNNKGLNHKLNPLYPQYPLYHPTNSCNCIWCVLNSKNIIIDTKNDLEAGQVKRRWNKLKKIRGVGPKIASLFLRDVSIWYELPPLNDDNRWLLQPIDIWVRRIAIALDKNNLPIDVKYENVADENVAKWIVNNSDRPEHCNQGMWYFGAKIAQTEFRLKNDLEDPQTAIVKHIKALKVNAQAILEL